MTKLTALSALTLLPALLAGCASTPEPEPEAVYIPPPEIRTCFAREELTLVEIPAETRTVKATTMIDNPPYEPIESVQEIVQEVRPAYTEYQDGAGNTVTTDMLCDSDLVGGRSGFVPTTQRPIPTGIGNGRAPGDDCFFSEQYNAQICPEGTVVN